MKWVLAFITVIFMSNSSAEPAFKFMADVYIYNPTTQAVSRFPVAMVSTISRVSSISRIKPVFV